MIDSSANVQGVRYRVGIDVGLKSIGFCAVEVDQYDQPIRGLRVKMCVWLGVSRGLDLTFLNAD